MARTPTYRAKVNKMGNLLISSANTAKANLCVGDLFEVRVNRRTGVITLVKQEEEVTIDDLPGTDLE